MNYYVYLIITKINNKTISYVGYTNDLKKRLRLDRLSKNNPLDVGKGGGTISNPKKPDDEK